MVPRRSRLHHAPDKKASRLQEHELQPPTMGFSFRGRAAEQPVIEGQASGNDVASEAIDINPEADLNKFKKLHK